MQVADAVVGAAADAEDAADAEAAAVVGDAVDVGAAADVAAAAVVVEAAPVVDDVGVGRVAAAGPGPGLEIAAFEDFAALVVVDVAVGGAVTWENR